MGLFGAKKKTFVSSVVYNMAGDIKDRPDYFKTLVMGQVLEQPKVTLTRTCLNSYLGGQGIKLRHFGRWAREHGYNANVGVVSSSVTLPPDVDTDALAEELTDILGNVVYVNEARVGTADYGMWASQYVLANYPSRYLEQWSADFDEATDEVVLKFPDIQPIRFTPTGFEKYGRYLYVSLNQEQTANSSSTIGDWINGAPPSLAGYELASSSLGSTPVELLNTVTVEQTVAGEVPVIKTYETPSTVDVELKTWLYTKREDLPDSPLSLVIGDVTRSIEVRETYEVTTVESEDTLVEEIAGVERTTVVTKAEQVIKKGTQYRVSTVTVRERAWGREEIFIYRQGTGNSTLDGFFVGNTSGGQFFPIVPIRIDNKFVSETDYAHLLPWVKKAVRRCTDFSYDKLVDMVADNKSLKDIDYVYMVFGCSLNTKENAAKRYIYEFFQELATQDGGAAMNKFWTDYHAAVASWNAWVQWYESGRYEYDRSGAAVAPPSEPVRLPMPTPPAHSVNINSAQNYNITISFSGVEESIHTGKYADGVQINDLRIYKGSSTPVYSYPEQGHTDQSGRRFAKWSRIPSGSMDTIVIEWQVSENTFRRMTVMNLVHTNRVYKGKAVVISAWEALDDAEESGFIFPLHEGILRSMPIPLTTQLCTACTYLMFNCYQVVKQKWYQTDMFKIILVVIIIVVSIFFPPAGSAAGGAGVLGSNAAVGGAVGFSGTAAVVAGAIINAIAALVITRVITGASRKLLGDKIGNIVGAIGSVIATAYAGGLANGQNSSMIYSNMMTAENLIKLTMAVGDGVAKYMADSAKGTQEETMKVLSDYEREARAIAEKYINEFGNGGGVIDPLLVAEVGGHHLENPSTFLTRSLMNGTDIADMSLDMLDNFGELTTALPLE